MTPPNPDHDALYHRFFSDPAIVVQLLREFVAGPWLDELDLDGLERVNTKFHADTGERREGDLVWRIPRRGGGEAYVMLLLEFQSTPDPWMALRMLVYAGLLWQHLIREQRLHPDGHLPPILPVVLYNGDPRWRAPQELRDLIGLPDRSPLWRWQPELRYHLIDEGAFSAGELEGREGLPALLFRLENASDRDQLVAVADAVLAWFGSHPGFQAARTVFVEVLSAGMAPFGPDVRVPEELLEVRNMLATRVEEWKQQWKQEGLQEGLREGLQEGLREGLQEGLREGLSEGLREGLSKGLREGLSQGLREGEERGRQQGEERGEQRGRRQGIADLLLRQLERRFGMLPGWARDRVQTADTITLMEWSLRVLDVETIEAVFA